MQFALVMAVVIPNSAFVTKPSNGHISRQTDMQSAAVTPSMWILTYLFYQKGITYEKSENCIL